MGVDCSVLGNWITFLLQHEEERQVGLRTSSWTLDIFVISEPKWLKFGLQAHFLKVFGHTKLQLPISCTFKVMILLVKYLVISTKSFITLKV